jgi:hypothetical protein
VTLRPCGIRRSCLTVIPSGGPLRHSDFVYEGYVDWLWADLGLVTLTVRWSGRGKDDLLWSAHEAGELNPDPKVRQ